MEDRGTADHPLPFDYATYVAFMVSHNFNWIRLWTSELSRLNANDDPYEDVIAPPFKWARTGVCCASDGGSRFDFRQLDRDYFERLRSRVMEAGRQGIYVSVMLFNGYMWQFDETRGDGNPFDRENNVNGIDCSATCPNNTMQLTSRVWNYQQAYLRKVVDTVNDLNNVMYEVSNESGSPYSDDWQFRVIRYVKEYEATKPKQHPVGMTFQFRGGTDETLYRSPADWISPSARVSPEATGQKVVINDTDHSYPQRALERDGQNAHREWAWENFTRGNNLAFMDPYLVVWPGRNAPHKSDLDPYWDEIRKAMTDVRNYATKIDLAHMTPSGSLSTSGFCLASPGSQYLVFGTSGSFLLSAVPGRYRFEWFDPSTHVVAASGTLEVEGSQTFTAPFPGDSVLWLHR